MHFFNTEKLLLAPFFSLDLCFHFIAPIELCGLPRCLNSKESACNAGDIRNAGSIPGLGRSLEEGMATHSSILSWRILGTEEPGGWQSMRLQRVGHDWSDWVCVPVYSHTHTHTHTHTQNFALNVTMRESESEVAQSCLTLCDPMDCSPLGSSIHGIF